MDNSKTKEADEGASASRAEDHPARGDGLQCQAHRAKEQGFAEHLVQIDVLSVSLSQVL